MSLVRVHVRLLSDRAWFLLVLWFVSLNAFDMAATWKLMQFGASEANPFMSAAIGSSWSAALTFKAVVTLGAASCMWFLRRERSVRRATWFFIGLFSLLTAYHILNLSVVV